MSTPSVLFIDDDESVLQFLSRSFVKLGYQTFTAASGQEGITEFNRTQPGVTVLDLHLPDISGFNVLEELRPQRPMIIMLTGDAEIAHAVEAMRKGAETFLTKPVNMSHLEMAVFKAAEKAALNREVGILRALMPSSKRKAAQAILVLALAGVSVVLGLLIGGSHEDPSSAPIPVPFNPQDTVLEVEETPFRPIPNPNPPARRPGDRGAERAHSAADGPILEC